MAKATEKDLLELLEVTADAAEECGYAFFSDFLRDMVADPSAMKISPVVAEQLKELWYRAKNSVLDTVLRGRILDEVQSMLDDNENDLDNDALINDNEESGYWTTCRAFVYYHGDDEDEGE